MRNEPLFIRAGIGYLQSETRDLDQCKKSWMKKKKVKRSPCEDGRVGNMPLDGIEQVKRVESEKYIVARGDRTIVS